MSTRSLQSGKMFLLQETHWKTEQEKFDQITVGFECVVAGNHTGSRGLAVLFKNNFEYNIHSIVLSEMNWVDTF